MTTWFVTRHAGTIAWAKRQGLEAGRMVAHLDVEGVAAGDVVVGTLPVHLAAAVCAQGARYLHLTIDIPHAHRGMELDADQIERFGARLEEYHVTRVGTVSSSSGPEQPAAAKW